MSLNNLKICHVNLARGFSGGESQTLVLVDEQIRLGYDLIVIAKRNSPFAKRVAERDCELIEISNYFLSHAKRHTDQCICMHVHEGQALYWALIQFLVHGTPYIVTRRIDNPFKKKLLSQIAYSKASAIVGVSNRIKQIARAKFPAQYIVKVNDSPVCYATDSERSERIKKTYADKFLVIQAAKLYKHKGFDVSIEAARLLEDRNLDIQICLLGDGPEHAALLEQGRGLTNLSLVGKQTNMGDWFSAADLLIHPAHSEGMGSVILEASLAGLPVIGSNTGGIPDAIAEEKNGLLIPANDPIALAEAIIRMKDDLTLQSSIKLNRATFIEKFDIKHAAKQYQEIYDHCAT